MAGDNDGDEMRTYQGKLRPMASGKGSSGPRDMPDGGSSGEGALDGSPGDNPDSEGGSTGSGWRGGNPQRSTGQSPDSEADLPRMKREKYGSTGPGITAIQAPNRPR